jgi:hypothetical protein
MKTIGIVGTRRRNERADYQSVDSEFWKIYEHGDELVSGGCPQGADNFAEIMAKKYQIPIKIYYAQWGKFGRAAGFQRNTLIARDADVLIACVHEDREGGTEDTIKKFINMGKKENLILV